MTYKIPKDPMKMSLKELFDMQQAIQRESKNIGEHYPMYTKRKPVNGEQPSAENMHEEATRKQLSQIYKQQNSSRTAQESAQDERLAQNLAKSGANALGALRDGAGLSGELEKVQHKRNQGWMREYKALGLLPSDFRKELENGNPRGFVGDFDDLEEQYKSFYYKK